LPRILNGLVNGAVEDQFDKLRCRGIKIFNRADHSLLFKFDKLGVMGSKSKVLDPLL
jgi:hypothetical protein